MSEQLSYLGTTVTYPLVVSNGSIVTNTGMSAVEQSVLDIISTQAGEVFFNRSYGSEVQEQIFDPNDEVLSQMLELSIAKALKNFEKRVNFVELRTTIEEAKINLTIIYRVLGQSELQSVAYTHYRNANKE